TEPAPAAGAVIREERQRGGGSGDAVVIQLTPALEHGVSALRRLVDAVDGDRDRHLPHSVGGQHLALIAGAGPRDVAAVDLNHYWLVGRVRVAAAPDCALECTSHEVDRADDFPRVHARDVIPADIRAARMAGARFGTLAAGKAHVAQRPASVQDGA